MRLVLIAAVLVEACECARILALTPFPSRSHWVVIEPLFQELAARGHHITMFSVFPQKPPRPNYTDVDLSHVIPPVISAFSVDMIKKRLGNPLLTTSFIHDMSQHACQVFKEPPLQELLIMKNQYDLVITELFGSDCFAYFAHKLKVPLISYTTSMVMPWSPKRTGLPDNPSYIPCYLVDFSPEMTLWERIYNTFVLIYAKFLHYVIYARDTQIFVEKNIGEVVPAVEKIVANTSLLLVNSYHTLFQSRPFPPNVIEVGGIHIKKRQPLDEDLSNILNSAKNGAILVSFGSLVRVSTLPKSIIHMLMNAFSKLPQTIIFKYEENLPEAPQNVVVRKWLPQRDIIEHENIIAIVAHGGLASTIEAVFFGKPLVGIPFFADQYANINAVVRRGAGVQLELDNLSERKVADALTEIINNPKYRENMEQLSLQFRDRPMTALQTAVYWTEYVIRHQGAPHLQPASVHLPFYQYLLLDVISLLIISVTGLIYSFRVLTPLLINLICSRSKQSHGQTATTKNIKKID